jgi:NitT/TauT family transport system ATP-binding protein
VRGLIRQHQFDKVELVKFTTAEQSHDELETLWRTTAKTVLFVTHNVREAIRLGDRVVLLTSRPGRVAQIIPVTIERPRRIDSPEIATLAATITDQLRTEMERHARGQ